VARYWSISAVPVSAHPSPLVITSFYNEISGGHIGSCRCSDAGPVLPLWYGRYGSRHTNLKFGMAATYQTAEIWAVDFRENYSNRCHQMSDLKAKMHQNRFRTQTPLGELTVLPQIP